MGKYKVERSDILYNRDSKSMFCTITLTHIQTQEKHVYKNIFLDKNNKEAFLVFPSTNDEVYINRETINKS